MAKRSAIDSVFLRVSYLAKPSILPEVDAVDSVRKKAGQPQGLMRNPLCTLFQRVIGTLPRANWQIHSSPFIAGVRNWLWRTPVPANVRHHSRVLSFSSYKRFTWSRHNSHKNVTVQLSNFPIWKGETQRTSRMRRCIATVSSITKLINQANKRKEFSKNN